MSDRPESILLSGKADFTAMKAEIDALRQQLAALQGEAGKASGVASGASRGDALVAPVVPELTAQAEATGTAAKAQSDLNRQLQTGRASGEAFANVLGQVNPELGMLARVASHLREILAVLFTPIGAVAAVAAAGIALITRALNDAEEAARLFADQMERIKQATIEVEEGVSQALGGMGRGSEQAFLKATAVAKDAEEKGFSQSTARRGAAAVVDDQGNLTMTEGDVDLFMAGVERGDIDLPKAGSSERQRDAWLRKTQRYIGRNRDSLAGSAQAYTRPRERQERRALDQSSNSSQAEILQRRFGYSQKDATEVVGDIDRYEDSGEFARGYAEGVDPVEGFLQDLVGFKSDRRKRFERAQQAKTDLDSFAKARGSATPASQPAGAQADSSLPILKEIAGHMARTAENTERTADNSGRPPEVHVNIGPGGGAVPLPGPGPRIR